MNNGSANAVEVRDLRVRRGKTQVFAGLQLDIPRGQITGLLGPSGCGKTTLMRSIVGVQKIDGGTVTVLGEPAGTSPQRRRVAYDTQAASVYGDLTVRQNLRYFARLIGAPRVGRRPGHRRRSGSRGHADQTIGSLSGGEETRVSLAVAMLGSPELLVLDEPTVGLDPVLRAELWGLFRGLADSGATHHRVEPRDGRGAALRSARARCARVGSSPTRRRTGLLAETGTTDPDAAFLALVERDEAGQRTAPARAGASAHPP